MADHKVSSLVDRSGHKPVLRRWTFSSSASMPSSRSTVGESSTLRYDLITFLIAAQRRQVDFLPITWQPALDGVGLGGTAEIRQSLLRLQENFAFKRIKESKRVTHSKATMFRAFTSEVTVLGLSAVRSHPNIVTLLGICWDVSPDGAAWPVLVFDKAELGNRKEFARSEAGEKMSLGEKLYLCIDVARAMRDLHKSSEPLCILN
jgi:serine/threonine protein kinase